MNINTNINMTYPMMVNKNGIDIEVGHLYATIGRQSNSINIQCFVNDKSLMNENIENIKKIYRDFYKQIAEEASLYGMTFINILDN